MSSEIVEVVVFPPIQIFTIYLIMKRKFTRIASICTLILSVGTLNSVFAQTGDTQTDGHLVSVVVPTLAILDIETVSASKDFTATFLAPTEAGEKLAPVTNSLLFLNYSSIQTGSVLKKVTVKTSAVVPGVDINVTAATATSTGGGTKGTPVGTPVVLTTLDQSLITGIGSAYTASGPTVGHQLNYNLVASDTNYGNLRSGPAASVTVTYTIADI